MQANWFEAYANCRRNHAFLVNINDSMEMELLANYTLSNDVGTRFWIDGNDLANEGTFLSTKTGSHLSFVQWEKGEPNNVHNAENCVQLVFKGENGTMNDNWCMAKYYSICEHEITLPILPVPNSSTELNRKSNSQHTAKRYP